MPLARSLIPRSADRVYNGNSLKYTHPSLILLSLCFANHFSLPASNNLPVTQAVLLLQGVAPLPDKPGVSFAT